MIRTLFQRIFIGFLIGILSACSYNPLSDNNHLTGNAIGPAVGAVAGAGTAAAMGVSSKAWLGLAGLGGASIGYYVTTLRFASAGIMQAGGQVYTLGDYVTIEIPSDQLFDTNSSELLPGANAILSSAATVLRRYPNQNIMVSGNTSGFGTARFEHRLSEDRAREVASFLWRSGITAFKAQSNHLRKLSYVGYGNYFPISNNIQNSGIRSNSRIQITAYPSKDQLLISKKCRAFENVGGFNEPHTIPPTPPDSSDAFSSNADVLPEQSTPQTRDFDDGLNESPMNGSISPNEAKSSDYFQERANLKGDDFNDQPNSVNNSVQTRSGGTVVKQGGFRGYKGE